MNESTSAPPGEVLVMGAGAVGCFVGGSLAAVGVRVCLVGRSRVLQAVAERGLTLTDRDGGCRQVPADRLRLCEQVPAGARPALVLLTVKSQASASASAELAAQLPAGSCVLSLQNGVSNARIAQQAAPALRVLPGMVSCNIAETAPGTYHRGTSGGLFALDEPVLTGWVDVFAQAGLPLALRNDMQAVQWGKLLINLNNPVNALSGLPLRAQLLDRGYRRCFAALMAEALGVFARAGIAPAQVVALPPQRLLTVLRLPTWLFRIVASRMLQVDATARSSMADDLALGRRTEVDALCGEVVRLARSVGLAAIRNARMVELLDGAWPEPPRPLTSAELCRALLLPD